MHTENHSIVAANRSLRRMRILICRSNPVAPDPRVEKEARALVNAGYHVTALAWDRSAKLPLQEHRAGLAIQRVPIKAEFGQGLGNLPALLRWQWGLTKWLIKHHDEYDVIHACDFDTILPCLLIKVFWKKPLIYDIFDFYADHLRRTPQWIKNIIRSLDYWAINQADAVILVDDARREQIETTQPRRLSIIYNSPEDALTSNKIFQPSPHGALQLAYVGLFQQERGLFEVLSMMKKHPQWTMEMAGFGGDEDAIHAICKELSNVKWYGRVSYEKALEISSRADVIFATYDPAIPNHRFSSPNKVFEAMMLGKPIIGARGTNMDRIILQNECGIVVAYGNELELEDAFVQLSNNPALRERLGRNARKAYETLYHWDIMKTRLIELYSQVLLKHA